MISTSSSASDCVAVFIWPRFMRILISSGIGTPSACERSLTLTPDSRSAERDDLDPLAGERLRRGLHLAEVHEDLDQLGHRDAQRLREILDVDAGLEIGRAR